MIVNKFLYIFIYKLLYIYIYAFMYLYIKIKKDELTEAYDSKLNFIKRSGK